MKKYRLWGLFVSLLFINHNSQTLGAEHCTSPQDLLQYWKNNSNAESAESVRQKFNEFKTLWSYDDLMKEGINPLDINHLSRTVFPHISITLNSYIIPLLEEALVQKNCPLQTLKIYYIVQKNNGKLIERFSTALAQNETILNLDLSGSVFIKEEINVLGTGLSKNESIKNLIVSKCEICTSIFQNVDEKNRKHSESGNLIVEMIGNILKKKKSNQWDHLSLDGLGLESAYALKVLLEGAKLRSVRSINLSNNTMTPEMGSEYCSFLYCLNKDSMDFLDLKTSNWKNFSGMTMYSTYEMVKNIGSSANKKIKDFKFCIYNNAFRSERPQKKAVDYQKFDPWKAAAINFCDNATESAGTIGFSGLIFAFSATHAHSFDAATSGLVMALCIVPALVYSCCIRDVVFEAKPHSISL